MLGLLGDVLGLVVSISSNQYTASGLEKNRSVIGLNVSITLGAPDTAEGARHGNTRRQRFEGTEPSIDIAETNDTIKIIINFPGIKEEDVQFNAKSGILEVIISKDGCLFRKEMPCDIKENSVSIESSTINNSVLDITLTKN